MSGQLIYTSCRMGIQGTGDGLQPFSYSIDIDPDEVLALSVAGSYAIEATGLPSIIEPELKDKYPIALRYTRLPTGRMAITQSTFLGVDWSNTRFGRNYISHSIIFESGRYPIEYYKSRSFVVSAEGQNFDSAVKPEHLPDITIELGNSVGLIDRIMEFIQSNGIDNLKKMAYYKPSEAGRIVISGREEDIVMWIAAYTMLFPPEYSNRITFSTYTSNDEVKFDVTGRWGVNETAEITVEGGIEHDPLFDDYISKAYCDNRSRVEFLNYLNDNEYQVTCIEDIISAYRHYMLCISADMISDSEVDALMHDIENKVLTKQCVLGAIVKCLSARKRRQSDLSWINTHVMPFVDSEYAVSLKPYTYDLALYYLNKITDKNGFGNERQIMKQAIREEIDDGNYDCINSLAAASLALELSSEYDIGDIQLRKRIKSIIRSPVNTNSLGSFIGESQFETIEIRILKSNPVSDYTRCFSDIDTEHVEKADLPLIISVLKKDTSERILDRRIDGGIRTGNPHSRPVVVVASRTDSETANAKPKKNPTTSITPESLEKFTREEDKLIESSPKSKYTTIQQICNGRTVSSKLATIVKCIHVVLECGDLTNEEKESLIKNINNSIDQGLFKDVSRQIRDDFVDDPIVKKYYPGGLAGFKRSFIGGGKN